MPSREKYIFHMLFGVFHNKLGCVVRMVVDSILPHAECGLNDHRKDVPPFTHVKLVMVGNFYLERTRSDEKINILIEGANATMLDLDHGTYPYDTDYNFINI